MVRRPALVPFRWEGHGLDIRAHVTTEGDLYLVAADVCEALEISVDAETDPATGQLHHSWPGTTTILPAYDDDVENAWPRPPKTTFYTSAIAITVAENHPSHLTADFTRWLVELAAQLDTAALERILDDTTRP